jgi:hypothetical protein
MIFLNEIPSAWRAYLDACDIDEETGEVVKPEGFEELVQDSNDAVMYRARYIRELKAQAEAVKNEIARLRDLQARIEKRRTNIEGGILEAMSAMQTRKVADDLGSVSLRHTKAVEVFDEYAIPAEYTREVITRSPDKKLIKSAIEAGAHIAGAQIVERDSVIIK